MASRYFGVAMLQWAGMTVEHHHAENSSRSSYPVMAKWLRE
ncbi:MAG: hypothetical protein WDO19_14975 [Bacteroidota bacterium]